MQSPAQNPERLDLIYQDERFIAVNKPSGMVVHRGWSDDPVTAADLVRDQIAHAPVHAVHRLDRGTSGVLLFARDAAAARFFQSENEAGRVRKTYIALVRGRLPEPLTLEHPVKLRETGERVPAVTEFTPLGRADRWTLVEARPRTGRQHQIRLHLKHLSCPIVGDVRYGKGDVNRHFRTEFGFNRLALHALSLTFTDPGASEVSLLAELPADFASVLQRLGLRHP